MKTKKRTEDRPSAKVRRRGGRIAAKLVVTIVITIVIMVAVLLTLVYRRVSDALLDKSENLIQETTGKVIQETNAWMNKTLTMLEMQKDTIEYEEMDIPERSISSTRWTRTAPIRRDCMWP